MSDVLGPLGLTGLLVAVMAGCVYAGWATCERAQANRLKDALKVAAHGFLAAETLLKAAQTEKSAAEALVQVSKALESSTLQAERLSNTVASIDGQMGAVLTALVNVGAMTHVDVRKRDRQRGEHDAENLPPNLESLANRGESQR